MYSPTEGARCCGFARGSFALAFKKDDSFAPSPDSVLVESSFSCRCGDMLRRPLPFSRFCGRDAWALAALALGLNRRPMLGGDLSSVLRFAKSWCTLLLCRIVGTTLVWLCPWVARGAHVRSERESSWFLRLLDTWLAVTFHTNPIRSSILIRFGHNSPLANLVRW